MGLVADMVDHEADLTTGQRVVLSEVLRSIFYAARLGKWLDERPSLVTGQGRLLPALVARERILANVVKMLDRLGTLDRRPPRIKSVEELLMAEPEPQEQEPEPEPQAPASWPEDGSGSEEPSTPAASPPGEPGPAGA